MTSIWNQLQYYEIRDKEAPLGSGSKVISLPLEYEPGYPFAARTTVTAKPGLMLTSIESSLLSAAAYTSLSVKESEEKVRTRKQ